MQDNFQGRCCRIHFIYRERLVSEGKSMSFLTKKGLAHFASILFNHVIHFNQTTTFYPLTKTFNLFHEERTLIWATLSHQGDIIVLYKLPFLQMFHRDSHVTYSLEIEKICTAFIHPQNSAWFVQNFTSQHRNLKKKNGTSCTMINYPMWFG